MPHIVDLKCPQCNAPQSGQTSPTGLCECPFCGHKYRLLPTLSPFVTPVGHPAPPRQAAPSSPSQTGGRRLLARVALVVVCSVALGALLLFRVTQRRPSSSAPIARPRVAPIHVPRITTTEEPAPPEVKPTATFTYHRIVNSYGTHYVYGVVKNTCSVALDKPKITAVLRDAAGKEVDTKSGYAERELAPGESSPVQILLVRPPAYATLSFETEARKSFAGVHRAEGLRLETRPPERNSIGSWILKGRVHNEGRAAARFVRVMVTALDREGRICGLAFSYADGGQGLAPGSSARYEVMGLFSAQPARFEFSVEGGPVD